jgi:hypothetical protein
LTQRAITAIIGLSCGYVSARAAHVIQVHNSSNKKITKLVISADGKTYAAFSAGNGIKPGETVGVGWDISNHQCAFYLKAVCADRSESTSQQFDICEKDVFVEFT